MKNWKRVLFGNGNPMNPNGRTMHHRVAYRSRIPDSVYEDSYLNMQRPTAASNPYATQRQFYHRTANPNRMHHRQKRRFEIMAVTQRERCAKYYLKSHWTMNQKQDWNDFQRWFKRRSGSSQWNLKRCNSAEYYQDYLRKVLIPELGFVGYDQNLLDTAQTWRLVQEFGYYPIDGKHPSTGKWTDYAGVTYYAEGANAPPKVAHHEKGYKLCVTSSHYVWYKTEFDAFNRAMGILPPYERWTAADFCVFQTDRREAGDGRMAPYSDEWFEMMARVPAMVQSQGDRGIDQMKVTGFARSTGWDSIRWR